MDIIVGYYKHKQKMFESHYDLVDQAFFLNVMGT